MSTPSPFTFVIRRALRALAAASPATSSATLATALAGTGLLLAACASTSVPVMRAAAPTIYLQSRQAPAGLAACLARRLPDTRLGPAPTGDGEEVLVSGRAWLIDVSPSREGALIAAHRGSDGDAIEPDVRFAIARCAL